MNDLSLFLYITELAGRVGIVALLAGVALALAAFVLPPKGVKAFSDEHDHPFMGFDRLKNWFIAWLILLAVSFFTPSRETLYMMAASEAGEAVATSPDGKQMLDKVKAIINTQLDELTIKKEQK